MLTKREDRFSTAALELQSTQARLLTKMAQSGDRPPMRAHHDGDLYFSSEISSKRRKRRSLLLLVLRLLVTLAHHSATLPSTPALPPARGLLPALVFLGILRHIWPLLHARAPCQSSHNNSSALASHVLNPAAAIHPPLLVFAQQATLWGPVQLGR